MHFVNDLLVEEQLLNQLIAAEVLAHAVFGPPHELRVQLVQVGIELLAHSQEHLVHLFLEMVLLQDLLQVAKEIGSCDMDLVLKHFHEIGLLQLVHASVVP